MWKQTFFHLNRLILLSIVGFSTIIPLVHLPQAIQPDISFQLVPVPNKIEVYNTDLQEDVELTRKDGAGQPMKTTSRYFAIPWPQLLQLIYLSGLIVALLASLTGFLKILILFHKEQVISKDGFRLLIAKDDIPAFSLGRYMFISRSDFETSGETILIHEQAHIRNGHFYDLIILEFVKIFYWFNPVIYWLIRDLKAVHEFQADDSTLNNGIDATLYQLLIIEKCVGHQKFALANSFNHCQIKNRIGMMNRQKSNNAWRWKAAAFLPILALLLMAFGRTEKVPNALDQDSTIKGIVLNPEFKPLAGAIISINNATTGTITGKDGKFTLKAVPKDGELMFSSVGYETAQLVPDFVKPMVIKLNPAKISNEKFVIGHDLRVHPLYVVNDTTVPYSFVVAAVKQQKIESINVLKDKMVIAKYGKKGKNGVEEVILKKGISVSDIQNNLDDKINSENQPIIFIDGVLSETKEADKIVHDRIESVHVWKGKEATDKYGERGKNGVVEIKLKKIISGLESHNSKIKPSEIETSDPISQPFHLKDAEIEEKSKSPETSDSKLNLPKSEVGDVYGKVLLSDGRPLQKSSVTIKGTNNRVITNKDGRFNFDNVPKDGELVFQNLGLITSIVKPDFKNFMIIKMESGSFWIDPVRVIGHVIDKTPPAALPKVSFASHMTVNPPLFIVDGEPLFIVDGEMADKSKMDQIEPDDVAFVNVLRGKSATDKYGPLAKNGALEIKTKKKVILPAEISKVNVEVNEYSDNQKMDIHSNNVIEEMPEFVGGMKELMKYIADNIKYPDQALTGKAQGNIEVNFIINQNGEVEKAKVAKDVHPALDAEAIRVISSMPDWNPGKVGGKSVDVSLTIPIRFSLK